MNAFTMTDEGPQSLRLRRTPLPDLASFAPAAAATTGSIVIIAERMPVYRAGDAAGTTYELVSGNVILWKRLTDGRRQILQVVHPNDTFGFCSRAHHDTTAEAVTTSHVRVVPIVRSTGSRADHAEFLMQALQRIEALQVHALLLGQMSALERLANFLLSHMSRQLDEPDELGDEPEIRLSVSRQEIGDYLGLTIETVSRCFGKLKSTGIIKLDQADRICVKDLAGLRAIASQSGRAKRSK